MAYAHKNLRITFGGRLYGNTEIWTNGITMGYEDKDFAGFPGGFDSGKREELVENIKTWFQREGTGISRHASLEWVKFAVIGTDGKYAGSESGDFELNETIDFDAVYGRLDREIAPQLSVALTMETNVRRGAGRFGRIYPPLTGSATGEGYDAQPTERASSFTTLLADLNDTARGAGTLIGGDSPKVIVASGVREGRNSEVVRVKVGRVIDTQRSRRNAMVEQYVSFNVADA